MKGLRENNDIIQAFISFHKSQIFLFKLIEITSLISYKLRIYKPMAKFVLLF